MSATRGFSSSVSASPVSRRAAQPRRSRIYVYLSLIFALVVLVGFHRSFFLRPLFKNHPLTPLAWVHAAVFTGWVALFFTQTVLVQYGRVRLHRRLGLIASVYAAGMVVIGIVAAIAQARHRIAAGRPHALEFLIIPLGDMALFAGLIGAAILWRRSPDIHKRLMMIATFGLLGAAFGRFPGFLPHGAMLRTPLFFYGAIDVLIAGAMLADWRRIGRLHPAYVWGGAVTLGAQIVISLGANTPAWVSIAKRLVA